MRTIGRFILLWMLTVFTFEGVHSQDAEVVPFAFTRLDALFEVDSDVQTVALTMRATYQGSADRFFWLIPTTDPNAEVIIHEHDDMPLFNIQVQLNVPPNPCYGLQDPEPYLGDPAPHDGQTETHPGIESVTLIHADILSTWLYQHTDVIDAETRQSIEAAERMGVNLIALEVVIQSPDGYEGTLPVVTIQTQNDQVSLPLRWMRFGLDAPLRITILGDSGYQSMNYGEVETDLRQVREPPSIYRPTLPRDVWRINYPLGYESLTNRLIKMADFLAFDTHYAGTTTALRERIEAARNSSWNMVGDLPRPILDDLLSKHQYVTHFWGLGGSLVPFDPVFLPSFRWTSEVRDAIGLTDPMTYYGCTTRTLPDFIRPDLSALPDGRSEDRQLAFPVGWQRSDFELTEGRVTAYAPVPVNAATLTAHGHGEATPPMLIQFWRQGEGLGGLSSELAGVYLNAQRAYYRLFDVSRNFSPLYNLNILTSPADFTAHEAMYRAMLAYPLSYPSPDPSLPHTLFFSLAGDNRFSNEFATVVYYPEGWIEQTNDGRLAIFPSNYPNLMAAPSLRMVPALDVAPFARSLIYSHPDYLVNWISSHFISAPQIVRAIYGHQRVCFLLMPAVPFNDGMRRGFVRAYVGYEQMYLIEASAPSALYLEYAETLRRMINAVHTYEGCG